MSVLGWFLAVFGVVGVVYALRMMSRMKKMQTVPLHGPGEIQSGAGKADAKGLISPEGQPVAGEGMLTAPMERSTVPRLRDRGRAQVGEDRRDRERQQDEVGQRQDPHRVQGQPLQPVRRDRHCRHRPLEGKPDGEFEKSHNSTVKVGMTIPGSLAFGQMQMNTPSLPRDSRTVAFVATEKVLKAGGRLYAMGAPKGGAISAPDGMLGKVLLSRRAARYFLAATKKLL